MLNLGNGLSPKPINIQMHLHLIEVVSIFDVMFAYVSHQIFNDIAKYKLIKTNTKVKSNLHYTRRITPKRVTSCETHLRGLARGQYSSEETSQRWRVVGDTVPIWPARESNPRPPALIACLATELTAGLKH